MERRDTDCRTETACKRGGNRTFRVFVSSTFADLKAERDALHRFVFPRLRELCERHGARFQAVDLRWGVSEEAGLEQRTMEICRQELDRCRLMSPRPNFVVLLGNRRGWCPLPESLPAALSDALRGVLTEAGDFTSLALYDKWYARDKNARDPMDVLLPRRGEFIDGETWRRAAEEPLRELLVGTLPLLDLSPTRQLPYLASATHHEILRSIATSPDSKRHAFGFIRRIANLDALAQDLGRVEEAQLHVDQDRRGNLDVEAQRYAKALWSEVKSWLPGKVEEYDCTWKDGALTNDYIGTLHSDLEECLRLLVNPPATPRLCQDVWLRLARTILEELEESSLQTAQELEEWEHRRFAEEHRTPCVGRDKLLDTLCRDLDGDNSRVLLLTGPAGSGKSTLMAQLASRGAGRAAVIARYIGVTPDSARESRLLDDLCRALSALQGISAAHAADDMGKVARVRALLEEGVRGQRVWLLLDALDQLFGPGRRAGLGWLPQKLGPGIRVVASVVPGPALDCLERQLPFARRMPVAPLAEPDARTLLTQLLDDAGRCITPRQQAVVDARLAHCSLPLYVRLLAQVAGRWRSWEGAPDVGRDVPALLRDTADRLSQEGNHGQVLVLRTVALLHCAKSGLAEDELLDLLSSDPVVMRDYLRRFPESPQCDELPFIVWSRLLADLQAFLVRRIADGADVLTFARREVAENLLGHVGKKFLGEIHGHMAEYFAHKGIESPRTLGELPYHQTLSGDVGGLDRTLGNLPFSIRKLRAEGPFAVLEDHELARQTFGMCGMAGEVHAFQEVIDRFSTLLDEVPDSLPTLLCFVAEEAYRAARTHVRRTPRARNDEEECLALEVRGHRPRPALHSKQPNDADAAPDGRSMATAGAEGRLVLWLGEEPARPRVLGADEGVYNTVRFSSAGDLVSGAGDSGRISVWEVSSGRRVVSLLEHRMCVLGLFWSPRDEFLASAGGYPARGDHEVRIWRRADWSLESRIDAGEIVNSLAFSRQEDLVAVASSYFREVRVFRRSGGEPLITLPAGGGPARALCFHSDGQTIYVVRSKLERWSLRGRLLACSQRLWGDSPFLDKVRLAFDAHSSRVLLAASSGSGGTATLEFSEECREIGRPPVPAGTVCRLRASPPSLTLLQGRFLVLLNPRDGKSLRRLEIVEEAGGAEATPCMAMSGNGTRVLEWSSAGRLRLHQLAGGSREVGYVPRSKVEYGAPRMNTGRHGDRWIVDNHLLDIRTGRCEELRGQLSVDSGKEEEVRDFLLTDDEEHIIGATRPTMLAVREVDGTRFAPLKSAFVLQLALRYGSDSHGFSRLGGRSRETDGMRRMHMPNFPVICFRRKDGMALLGAGTGEVFLVATAGGDRAACFAGLPTLESNVTAACWSEDGEAVAVGTKDGQIAVAMVPEAFEMAHVLRWSARRVTHAHAVDAVAFVNLNGTRYLVSCARNHRLALTDAATGASRAHLLLGRRVRSLAGSGSRVSCLSHGNPRPVLLELVSIPLEWENAYSEGS